jgi:hypothetical protein
LPYTITEFQDTPNPNALKCVLDRPLPHHEGLRSYTSAGAASGDPLAAELFLIPGVVGVLINPAWVTVSRSPGAAWKPIKAGVARVLGGAE